MDLGILINNFQNELEVTSRIYEEYKNLPKNLKYLNDKEEDLIDFELVAHCLRIKIEELNLKIKDLKYINNLRKNTCLEKNEITLGSIVEIQIYKKITKFMLVTFSGDSSELTMSISSPVGNLLIGKKNGDTLFLKTPRGKMKLKILSIV